MVLQCHSLFPDFTHQHSQPIPATTSACHYPVAYCSEFITIESCSHTPTPSHAGRSAGVKCIVTIIIKNCIIVVPYLSSTYIYHHSGISLFISCFRFAFVHVYIFMSSIGAPFTSSFCTFTLHFLFFKSTPWPSATHYLGETNDSCGPSANLVFSDY